MKEPERNWKDKRCKTEQKRERQHQEENEITPRNDDDEEKEAEMVNTGGVYPLQLLCAHSPIPYLTHLV